MTRVDANSKLHPSGWDFDAKHPLTILLLPVAGTLAAFLFQMGRARHFAVPVELVRIGPEDVIRSTLGVLVVVIIFIAVRSVLEWTARRIPFRPAAYALWSNATIFAFLAALGLRYGFGSSRVGGVAIMFVLINTLSTIPTFLIALLVRWFRDRSFTSAWSHLTGSNAAALGVVNASSESEAIRLVRRALTVLLLGYLCVITGRIDARTQARFLALSGSNSVVLLMTRDQLIVGDLRPGTRFLSGLLRVMPLPGKESAEGLEWWPAGRVLTRGPHRDELALLP